MCYIVEEIKSPDYLDVAFKSATILIALFNVYFAIKIFRIKDKKDILEKERDRKLQLIKTLVFDHNLKYFYETFDLIELELEKLKQPNLTDLQKQEIDTKLGDQFISLRRKFYDCLLAIDVTLYDSIKNKADGFQSKLTSVIFDPGVNLSHSPKFDELVNDCFASTKTDVIKLLFDFRG